MPDWKHEHDCELSLRREWSARAQKAERLLRDAIKEIERLRTALQEISQPLMTMQDRAKAEGCILNGETALNIISNPEYYRQIADEYAEVARLETEMAEDRPAIPSGVGSRLCKRAGINLDS